METLVKKRPQVPVELQGLRPTGTYTFDELYRLAQACQASGLFDDTTDAAQALVKILRGQEMGLPPTTAMTAFDIIGKRLFVKPWVLAAKINHCGYGAYRVLVQTETVCTIEFRRKYPDSGWETLEPESYTIEEAKAQGFLTRASRTGGRDPSHFWKVSPAHMLYMRCMGRGAMRHFPELAGGLELPPEPPPTPDQAQQNIQELWGAPPPREVFARRSASEETLAFPEEARPPVMPQAAAHEEGWRQRLDALLPSLPDAFVEAATPALTDRSTAPGYGMHLLAEAERILAAQDTPQKETLL